MAESIWSSTVVPFTPWDLTDNLNINVGTRFFSSSSGTVDGIKFFRSTASTGVVNHTVSLYTSTGGLLGQKQTSGIESSLVGWQYITFTSGNINITAHTTYVAAVFWSGGRYPASSANYFASQKTNGLNLIAPQSSTSSAQNGLYLYSSVAAFPSTSFNMTCYFADVIFTAASVSTDIQGSAFLHSRYLESPFLKPTFF